MFLNNLKGQQSHGFRLYCWNAPYGARATVTFRAVFIADMAEQLSLTSVLDAVGVADTQENHTGGQTGRQSQGAVNADFWSTDGDDSDGSWLKTCKRERADEV